jgi:hypothetical protein
MPLPDFKKLDHEGNADIGERLQIGNIVDNT